MIFDTIQSYVMSLKKLILMASFAQFGLQIISEIFRDVEM